MSVQVVVAGKGGAALRPMEHKDIPSTAALFSRVFGRGQAPEDFIENELASLYLGRSTSERKGGSVVAARDDGTVEGFIGVFSMPYIIEGARYDAAFCGSLMVDPESSDPMLGAKLLRGFLNGPQDISLSDTANPVSLEMWLRLKGIVLPAYSLKWLRIFRPSAYLVTATASRFAPVLRRLPLTLAAKPLDALATRIRPLAPPPIPNAYSTEDIDTEDFAKILSEFTLRFNACPDWNDIDLGSMVLVAEKKPAFGEMTRRVVVRGQKPVGAFIYHAYPSGIGYVLQVVAAPGLLGPVIDTMFSSAYAAGLSGLNGRSQQDLLEVLLTRRCLFLNRGSTVAHSKNPALLEPFVRGDAFVNGFAGEGWTAFQGSGL